MGILITILLLSVIIVIHEYGHYFVMRRNGIQVVEFTIGFGPTLFSRRLKSGTEFKLKPILLGGYAMPVKDGPHSMEAANRWVKFKVYMAGMFFNTLAAFVTITIIGYATGRVPALFLPYLTWAPTWLIPLLAGIIGSFGLWLGTPALIVWMLCTMGGDTFMQGAAGPVGIVAMGNQIVSHAGAAAAPALSVIILKLATFFYAINIGVAGCNLLPFFPLDGGHCFALLLDKLGGKKYGPKLVSGFRWVTGLVFLALVVFIFYSDFAKLLLGRGFPRL